MRRGNQLRRMTAMAYWASLRDRRTGAEVGLAYVELLLCKDGVENGSAGERC